jgi:hypothetical protein
MNEILAKLTEAINIQVDNVNIAREINFMVTQLIVAVEKEVENKYTDTDLQEFAEWCGMGPWIRIKGTNNWFSYPDGKFENRKIKTTSDLQIEWEIETGRRVK